MASVTSVIACGSGEDGELGLGTYDEKEWACVVEAVEPYAFGGWHCLAVDDQGRAYSWGGNEYGQCGEEPSKDDTGRPVRRDIVIPKPCAPKLTVRQVAAGGTHSVVETHVLG